MDMWKLLEGLGCVATEREYVYTNGDIEIIAYSHEGEPPQICLRWKTQQITLYCYPPNPMGTIYLTQLTECANMVA